MKTPCILLQLTHTSLFAYTWQHRHIIQLDQFDPDLRTPDAKKKFISLIQKHRKNQFRLIVEVLEEDFQFETIPWLSSRDQRIFLSRKLNQLYQHTAYHHATVLTKHKEKQKTDVVFSALLHIERIELIVNMLLAQQCTILGIYSSGLTTAYLAKRLQWPAENILFLGENAPDSVRYSFFASGKFRFCRLSIATPKLSTAVLAEEWASEIQRTWKHLIAEGQINSEYQLSVVLPKPTETDNALFQALEMELSDVKVPLSLHLMPVREMARQLGLPYSCANWQQLVLASVMQGRITNHYTSPSIEQGRRLRYIDHLLRWANLPILLMSFLIGYILWNQSRQLQTQIQSSRTRLEREQKQVKQALAKAKEKPDIGLLSLDSGVFSHLREQITQYPNIEETAKQISQFLLYLPLVVIDHWEWETHQEDESERRAIQQIEIVGHLEGEWSQAQAQLNTFLNQLKAVPGAQASLFASSSDQVSKAPKQPIQHLEEREEKFKHFIIRCVVDAFLQHT